MKASLVAAVLVSSAIGYFCGGVASSAVPARMGSGDVVYVSTGTVAVDAIEPPDNIYIKGVNDGIDEMIRIFNDSDLVLSMEEIGELARVNLFADGR